MPTRLHQENINNPDWFNEIWKLEGIHVYDTVRLRKFLQFVQQIPHARVLDVGAGLNGFAQFGVHRGYPGIFTAFDFSEEAWRRALEITPTLRYEIGDALKMPYSDNHFDIVGSG